MGDNIETTLLRKYWHILEKSDNKYHVYSPGLRPYGGFNTISEAYDYIKHNRSYRNMVIIVQDKIGCIVNIIYPKIKIIQRT